MYSAVRQCTPADLLKVFKYVAIKQKGYKITLTEVELLVYITTGSVWCIENESTKKIEGICIAKRGTKTGGVFIPLVHIDNKHKGKLTQVTLYTSIAKYVGTSNYVIQFKNSKVKSKHLTHVKDNLYVINAKGLSHPLYQLLLDSVMDPMTLDIEPEILKFKKEYSAMFDMENHFISIPLIKKLRKYCDKKLETDAMLMYLKEQDTTYSIIGIWSKASEQLSHKENMKIFRTMIKFLDTLDKPITIPESLNLHPSYIKKLTIYVNKYWSK